LKGSEAGVDLALMETHYFSYENSNSFAGQNFSNIKVGRFLLKQGQLHPCFYSKTKEGSTPL